MSPDDDDTDPVDKGNEQRLGENRVAQAKGGREGLIESRQVALGDQMPVQESPCYGTHATMHHELGNDQKRQNHQESDVNLQVEKERHGHAVTQQVSFQSGERQQRQPGKESDDGDTLAHNQERVVGQARPTQELKERAAQNH